MKKILFIILCFVSTVSFAQSYLTNNAVFNLKDSRNSNVYRFAYLNNTDSIATMDSVGLRIIRPLRFKGGTTSQRPAFAVEGMLWYNSDSLKLEYYNGAAWQSLGVSTSTTYTAGSGLTLSAGQFKLGGTLLENLSLSTTGAYTFSLTDGTTPLIHTDINERISIGGTNNSGYKFFVNGDFGAASGTGALYFNGATSLIYTAGTADMALRLTGRSKEFRHLIFTTAYVFRPNTDNTLPYEIQNVAGEKIFVVDFANKLSRLHFVPTAVSPTSILLKQSDSSVSQLPFTGSTTNFLRGDGTFAAPSTGLPSQTGNAGKFLTTDATNASWAFPVYPWNQAGVDSANTSNATSTTVKTITIPDASRGIIEVRMDCIGSDDGTKGLTGIKRVRYKKTGGTLTLGTVETEMAIEYDGGLSTATFTITTSSNNIIIQVTGEAATNLKWKPTFLLTNNAIAL